MSDITTRVSVVGEAVYPHLNRPDVRFNEYGEYKVTLKIGKQEMPRAGSGAGHMARSLLQKLAAACRALPSLNQVHLPIFSYFEE